MVSFFRFGSGSSRNRLALYISLYSDLTTFYIYKENGSLLPGDSSYTSDVSIITDYISQCYFTYKLLEIDVIFLVECLVVVQNGSGRSL